jgi:hypothetical protein
MQCQGLGIQRSVNPECLFHAYKVSGRTSNILHMIEHATIVTLEEKYNGIMPNSIATYIVFIEIMDILHMHYHF